jgi:outer membrane protein assembly factor BamD (BamD/ComL family)
MFDIAYYWLEDTRNEMKEDKEVKEGKRSFLVPDYVHFERSKPVLGEQDRAIEALQHVQLNDPNGPLADKAMYLCGQVHMYMQDYRSAVQDFKEITDHHPNSPLAPVATQFGILCLHLSTGGPDYDGKNSAEARKLIQTAFDNYPELAEDKTKREFLIRQLENITNQQAEKDYLQAEFYRRTGHPGSAYFYYGLIVRTYPTTSFAKLAKEKMVELKAQADKDNATPLPGKPPQTEGPPPAQGVPGQMPALPSPTPVQTPRAAVSPPPG